MLFDTDILIWIERGNQKAARLIDGTEKRYLSIQSYMEFLQGATSQKHLASIKDFISSSGFIVLPFTENIGHRASIYIEEYAISTGIRTGDAIIAATAVENNLPLASGNERHFNKIRDLKLRLFSP